MYTSPKDKIYDEIFEFKNIEMSLNDVKLLTTRNHLDIAELFIQKNFLVKRWTRQRNEKFFVLYINTNNIKN